MRRARAFLAFTAVLGGLFMSSCKKQTVDVPQSSDPVFTASGTIDASAFTMVAGNDNAYMFTSIEDENNIPFYTGKLSNGDLSIEIGIYDGLIDMPDHRAFNSLPSVFNYSRKFTSPLAILTKNAFPNIDVINHINWSIDGVIDPNAGDTVIITEPGKYEVCAHILFADGSSEILCSELILGYERHANFDIKHFLSPEGKLTAWVEDPQVVIEKVEWFLDNTIISSTPELSYPSLPGGNHFLRADVFFENGVKRSKNMIVDGNLAGNYVDDLSFFENGTVTLLNRDFNVRLKLEQNGTTFSSDLSNNSMNKVTFNDVSYYGKDVDGNNVYKVKAHIEATVFDVQSVNGSRELEFDTTFGIAISND